MALNNIWYCLHQDYVADPIVVGRRMQCSYSVDGTGFELARPPQEGTREGSAALGNLKVICLVFA